MCAGLWRKAFGVVQARLSTVTTVLAFLLACRSEGPGQPQLRHHFDGPDFALYASWIWEVLCLFRDDQLLGVLHALQPVSCVAVCGSEFACCVDLVWFPIDCIAGYGGSRDWQHLAAPSNGQNSAGMRQRVSLAQSGSSTATHYQVSLHCCLLSMTVLCTC